MTMMMSNLPKDLLEEILSRVPIINLRAVRSTCKRWNDLSKTRSFANKHIDKAAVSGEKEFLMITEFSACLVGVNLITSQNNNVDLSINQKGKLIPRGKTGEVFSKSQVIHCNGVFLCVWGNMLVVWNPYWGQTKWIMPRPPYRRSDKFYDKCDMYALGYDKSSGSHKILRLFGSNQRSLDIYDLSSKLWIVADGTLERDVEYMQSGVSLKGDTYWYARDKGSVDFYLFCFDFTRERFGPRLPLPIISKSYVSLSAVREEKLALFIRGWYTLKMEFWVTNNIEPDAVSWSKFLKVDTIPSSLTGNFLIDEEKKVAVLFGRDEAERFKTIYNNAYIIGENGYLRSVDLRKSQLCQFACSYVPSSAQIN